MNEIDDRSEGAKMGFSDNEVRFEIAEYPVECAGCGTYGEKSEFAQCDNCLEWFCQDECEGEMTSWRGMTVCWDCKRDLVMDKGADMEDLLAQAEAMEDR